jgi:DNA-binding GntR family transcriptional regulator
MPRKPSQADRVHDALRESLTRGEIPIGARLVEQQLAARFKTSRTPIREALRRLEGDGHLTRDAGGGLRPRVPSIRSMRELYEVRIVLEDLIVHRAAEAGDRAVLDTLDAEWRALEAKHRDEPAAVLDAGTAFVHSDEDFHERIARASGNAVAAAMLGDINARIRILRIHDFTRTDRIAATITEHLEILDAVRAGQGDTAAELMRAHVERSAAVVREQIGEVLSRMVEAPAAA